MSDELLTKMLDGLLEANRTLGRVAEKLAERGQTSPDEFVTPAPMGATFPYPPSEPLTGRTIEVDMPRPFFSGGDDPALDDPKGPGEGPG